MAVITSFPLRDGALLSKPRSELIATMADELARADAWRNEADAIRVLMWKGYPSWVLLRNLDDIRQAAMQSVVAREMSR